MELYSFLPVNVLVGMSAEVIKEFPSPYGVSFILIRYFQVFLGLKGEVFPSPYGVSFILILLQIL
ncbi:hypothetical protein HMPREF0400_00663 [Fusobacterium periodonticum 1_1_41FAA]|uniref:Uncharacterized protein n=1 Tax=Fusobacterium periodonticum 1_1_41FAA TaxID=469621 RepID=D6LG14_9FUSO|nr:hypothetical protein HMPREF0400_00663 [Fusobacterium periodonticum 1_1_41FAA]